MKLFTVLMACYLMLLSVIPCRDKQTVPLNSKEVATISAVSDNQHDSKHNTDTCTPFCNCSRCAASAFFQLLPSFTITKVEITISYPIPHMTFVSHEDKSIWQPPQLS